MKFRTISHSEITTYLDCQKKWDLIYNKKIKKQKPDMIFGEVAHKAMETRIIPDENLYPELKEAFNIESWNNYFSNIFKEIDYLLKDYEIIEKECKLKDGFGITGVIDLVCKKKDDDHIYIFDYKFTNYTKDYSDLYLDEQLSIYAHLYSCNKIIDLDKIKIGYISIPKSEIKPPQTLRNGTLSKSKSQVTTKELFLNKIKELNLNINDYREVIDNLPEYIHIINSSVNKDQCDKIIKNVLKVKEDIETSKILECYIGFKCKHCDYLKECKYANL